MYDKEQLNVKEKLQSVASSGNLDGNKGEGGALSTMALTALFVGDEIKALSSSIENLDKNLVIATRSSESLTKSIRCATWVGVFATIAGVIIGVAI